MVKAGLLLAEMLAWDGVAVLEHQHELAAGSGQQLAGAALVRHSHAAAVEMMFLLISKQFAEY